jgi:hypothetical protein
MPGHLLRHEGNCALSFALSDHESGWKVLVSSMIMPVESAKATRHLYRCRITRIVLDTAGLMNVVSRL